MSHNILFIIEGERTEMQIVDSLQNFFVNENTLIKCVYGGEIYQIYKEIVEDDDLDTFSLLKERNQTNKEILKDYTRADFAEIYLFFDYDGHSTLADDNKLIELIEFFNEETEKGKLYVSYPMVEALKHIVDFDTFKDLIVPCKESINYKELVARCSMKNLINFNKYEFVTWKSIIISHLMKMNYIVTNSYVIPNSLIEQSVIFSNQMDKYISPTSSISVLSAFPIFIHDYYGNIVTLKKLLQ